MGNGSGPAHPASCLLAELPAAQRPQSTIPADALDERKTMWGRHFRPSDRPAIADPMSHTPTRHILSDARANLWLVSGGLRKNPRNHGLFAKKEKGGPKRKKREPPYGKAENAKTAFPAFPQGPPPETKKDLKRQQTTPPATAPDLARRTLDPGRRSLTRYWIHSSAVSS